MFKITKSCWFLKDLKIGLFSTTQKMVFVKFYSSKKRDFEEFNASVRDMYGKNKENIEPLGWFLLVIPVAAFCLGTWQVQRLKWKNALIAELKEKTALDPISFPENISDIEELEYRPIKVRGTFDHTKELYLGPRSLLKDGDAITKGTSFFNPGQTGFHVVTPFHLADRNLTILVDRGWVPQNEKHPSKRLRGQVEGEVELVGIVRLTEKKPSRFSMENKPESKFWIYRDLENMSRISNAAPILLEATKVVDSSFIEGGPIPGQTRINLRNEHFSYIITWYGLSASTAFMWYRQFVYKIKTF